jgi:hypothetical protein
MHVLQVLRTAVAVQHCVDTWIQAELPNTITTAATTTTTATATTDGEEKRTKEKEVGNAV